MEHFKALVGIIENYGGAYGNKKPGLITSQLIKQRQPGLTDLDEIKKAEAMCCEQYLSCMILQGLDSTRYYQLKTNLVNDMMKGSNNFPKTIVEVVRLLNNYKLPMRHQCNQEPNGNGVAFVQGNGRLTAPKSKIECWHCSKKGHYKNKCHEL
jgi:hypothetical protein